jgi:hypothetical protein
LTDATWREADTPAPPTSESTVGVFYENNCSLYSRLFWYFDGFHIKEKTVTSPQVQAQI